MSASVQREVAHKRCTFRFFMKIQQLRNKGVARCGKGKFPPKPKKCGRNGVISEGSIFITKFSKNKIKNKIK